MQHEESHISDHDLLWAADHELTAGRIGEIQAHLASCWTCRTRMGELDRAIADFVQIHHSATPLPPADGPRALLKLRMAELAAAAPPKPWQRLASATLGRPGILVACSGLIFVGLAAVGLRSLGPGSGLRTTGVQFEGRAIPDPDITPGATLPVTRNDVCAAGMAETVRLVPAPIAQQVFAAYGIHQPPPRAYELDYLITPALGGSDNIRNFWPQPYGATVWNAHIKDALEDHLYQLVCAGKLELPTAQDDIARDWTAAYRKYFRTNEPLPQHASFTKDRPWE